MFDFLVRYLPRRPAIVLTGVWYALLIWAIFFALPAPQANFRYWWI